MRRSAIQALATVSLAALVGVATSSHAGATAFLGTLKQLDQWKVGIVDPEGQSFCAMVSKFDKNTGLAFALSPDGYGSVAVDMANSSFMPGETYKLALKTGGKKSTFTGRATSDRSVVVQIGKNTAFYDSLKSNAPLGISLPTASADFSFQGFQQSYGDLVDCAKTLNTPAAGGPAQMPAVKVKEVEKASLGPAQSPSKGGEKGIQLASAETVQKAEKPEVIWSETPKVERKVLATTKTFADVPEAEDTGVTAKLWDDRSGEEAQKAELLRLAEEENKARIAVLEAVKREAAKQHVATFNTQQKTIDTQTEKLQQQAVALGGTGTSKDKAHKASIVAKQAELIRLDAERLRQTQDLTKKLASTQGEFQSKVSAIAAERDQLKKQLAETQSTQQLASQRVVLLQGQLDAALAKGSQVQKDKAQVAELQARLQQAEKTRAVLEENLTAVRKDAAVVAAIKTEMTQMQSKLMSSMNEKQELEARLATVEKQSKLVSSTLGAKGKESGKETAAYKAEATKLLAGYQKTVEDLQRDLKDQSVRYTALQDHHESLKQQARRLEMQNAKLAVSTEESSRHEAYVSQLEARLLKADEERVAALASVATAKTARKSLIVINDDDLPPSLVQNSANAATLAKAQTRIAELERQLGSSRDQASELQKTVASKASFSAAEKEQALREMRSKLELAQAEVDSLKTENRLLTGKIATTATPAQTAALGSLSSKLEAAEAEVQRLKAQNTALSEKTPAKRPSLVYLPPETSDMTGPYARIRELENKVAELKKAPEQQQTAFVSAALQMPSADTDFPAADVVDDLGPIISAPVATMPAPARKPLQRFRAQQQQASLEARRLQAIEPAAGGAPIVQQAAPPVRRFAVPAAAPVVRAPAPVVQKDPSFDGNRAAAFLDRILAYHRTDGEKPAAMPKVQGRVFGTHEKPAFTPFVGGAAPAVVAVAQPAARATPTLRGYRSAPVAAAAVPVVQPKVAVAPVEAPRMIEQPSVQPQSVQQQPVVMRQRVASALSVEQILASAGIKNAVFQPAQQDASGGIVRQWTTGGLSGMYEQTPAQASFGENMESYLARYREDCPALTAQTGPSGKTETGVYEVASISCAMQGNAYSTSFVFWQDGQKFSAVLHSGYLSDASQVKNLADNVGQVLSDAGGLLSPQVVQHAAATVATPLESPQPQLRFNIPQTAAAPSDGGRFDGLKTVVIE